MKLAFVVISLVLLLKVQAIVDRTYFNYLGRDKLNQVSKSMQAPKMCRRPTSLRKRKLKHWTSRKRGLKRWSCSRKVILVFNLAYETLSNDKERQKYERYGKDVFKTIKEMTCIDKRNPDSPK